MSSLTETLTGHLNGQVGLAELASSLATCRKELVAHQEDVSSILAGAPDFLVAIERDAWMAVFTTLDHRLTEAEKKIREREFIQELATELPQLMDELAVQSLSVRECGWSARGPSSHSGVNEILYLLEQFADGENEHILDLLDAKLEVEFTRFEHQAELYQELPEFIAEAMEELLPEYRELLEATAQVEEMEEEDLEELFGRFEEWGANYSAYDIDFLSKRYSQVPTPVPSVNLALNCQLLFLEEIISEDMLEHAIEGALETLQGASERFLEDQKLSDVDAHAYEEIFSELLAGLESLPEVAEKEQLKEAGGKLITLTARFIETQGRSETEAGSRLDFKSE